MLYIIATVYNFPCNVILGLALYKLETEIENISLIISIIITQLFFVCLCVCVCLFVYPKINWKDYESQKAENLYSGVILYC